jgi:transketolase C-terminal domain/subunit
MNESCRITPSMAASAMRWRPHRLGITQLPRSGASEELLERYGISRGRIEEHAIALAA